MPSEVSKPWGLDESNRYAMWGIWVWKEKDI